MIKQVLDLGAHGVVVPHVQTPEEAQKVVEACRYAQAKDSPYPIPAGTRGASPWVCAFLWGLSMPEYIKRADVWPLNPEGDIMAVVMIEDTVGLGNADAILKVPGIGALMYGPYDFSFASGHFGDTTAPVVVETWKTLKKACDKANVPLIGFADPSNVEELVRENYRMLLIGTNIDLAGGPGKVLEILRKKKF
jgi:4-hydroxy-2-oxoheptanedioate aldolase